MNKLYLFFTLILCISVKSQILNAYAKVTSITGGNVLSVSNVNTASHTFTVGGKVLIMQMQDDVIGTNTADVATFGDLSGIAKAGIYEFATITAVSPSASAPTSITLSSALANTFNTGVNSSLQVVTFRSMGSNYTTSANITGLAWDGNVGGIIAFEVTNTLTLNHSISADFIGFRKGGINTNSIAGSCYPNLYRTSANSEAFKGEGIYKVTDVNYTNARGKIINGGGGGNQHNAGGGGGGNFSAGGQGGFGYSCGTGSNSGGLGGIALSSYITGNRIFMGGGGGGGQQNNTVGLDGGAGGGIILIKAATLLTNTVCSSPIKITANGAATLNSGNDGTGGGGAAGTIVLQITNYSNTAACPLTIAANGGNGGNVGDAAEHGGGGGGAQGAVIFSATQPTLNITTTTTNGTGGKNNSAGTSSASPGSGANNAGILSLTTPLPIELLSFDGEPDQAKVKLHWTTATEINNDYYIVEKSTDALHFTYLGKVNAVGNTYNVSNYSLYDNEPNEGINYYRLKQTDTDGRFTYSQTVSVNFEKAIIFSVFPNPANSNDLVYLSIEKSSATQLELSIYDIIGKQISTQHINLINENKSAIQITPLEIAKGVYMIRIYDGITSQTKKLIIH